MMKPLTDTIQTIGLSSNLLGRVHFGSNWRIFSMLRISLDLPWPVLSATPNALSMNGKLQMRLLAGIVQEVDPANGADDATGPGLQLASQQR